jgi:hypothetical protein
MTVVQGAWFIFGHFTHHFTWWSTICFLNDHFNIVLYVG